MPRSLPGKLIALSWWAAARATALVSQLLESRLSKPAHREINPDLCVAMGAAVQGAIIAGSDVGAVLVDITPHSMGIKAVDSMDPFSMYGPVFHFAPIIPPRHAVAGFEKRSIPDGVGSARTRRDRHLPRRER